mgnify:FL=1
MVDASCIPARGSLDNDGYFHGRVEWQGRDLATGERLFASTVYPQSTINIGESCAIIEALRYLRDKGDTRTVVYSDSEIAINWVSNGYHRSKLPMNEFTWEALDKMDELFAWLVEAAPMNTVRKWETRHWGENPADYGRK